jgi:DNA-binding MarR family transcriptional regulator
MAKKPLQHPVAFGPLVRDISRLIRKRFETKALKVGLTQSQWALISQLIQHEGINQAALAEMMDIEPITVVGLLDRLEKAGWVERRPDPDDRRAHLLYLTKKVNSITDQMESIKAQLRKEAFAGVPAQQEQLIMQTLQRIRSNLAERVNY